MLPLDGHALRAVDRESQALIACRKRRLHLRSSLALSLTVNGKILMGCGARRMSGGRRPDQPAEGDLRPWAPLKEADGLEPARLITSFLRPTRRCSSHSCYMLLASSMRGRPMNGPPTRGSEGYGTRQLGSWLLPRPHLEA